MHLQVMDIAIIVLSLASIIGIGFWVANRSGKSSKEFFLSGQSMPWWMLGLSMVATTFAADTPGLVSGWARNEGIAKNWSWWAFCISGMLTVFLYSKLWRRSGVLTDMEFYELRYSGPEATFLRGFRSVYLGFVFNVLVMANVNLAAIKISAALFGFSAIETILIAAAITALFSAVGGFRGVVISDILLFVMAILGAIAAAYFVVGSPEVGSLGNLLANKTVQSKASFIPDFTTDEGFKAAIQIMLIPLAIQWWAAWYPGAEPGGGGYIAQRMLAAKDENNAQWATLLFNVAHYAVRPWPWIIVGLASIILLPMDSIEDRKAAKEFLEANLSKQELADLKSKVEILEAEGKSQDPLVVNFYQSQGLSSIRQAVDPKALSAGHIAHDLAYPLVLRKVPSPWLGLIVASLLAAYISTISTHLNWGASYLVHDFHLKFVQPDASDKTLVWVGRFWTIALMVVSVLISFYANSAGQMFDFIISFGAGTGLIYLLRWYWWRINAWGEIAAMIFSGVFALSIPIVSKQLGTSWPFPEWANTPIQVLLTTMVWIAACYLGPKTSSERLVSFLKKIHPPTVGWAGFINNLPEEQQKELAQSAEGNQNQLATGILQASFACIAVYAVLLGTGFFLYQQTGTSISLYVVALIAAVVVFLLGKRK